MDNKSDVANDTINIVSLGETCVGRVILARYGMIKMKKDGRLSLPFDLGVHPSESMLNILENNFIDYLDKKNLHYNEARGLWINEKYRVLFNHDRDLTKDDMPKLIERYTKRIENFNQIVKNSSKTFFIFSEFRSNFTEFIRLKEALMQYTDNFHIIVLNHKDLKILEDDCFISTMHCPFPSKEYKDSWSLPSSYASEAGMHFEESIIKHIKEIITHKSTS